MKKNVTRLILLKNNIITQGGALLTEIDIEADRPIIAFTLFASAHPT